MASSTEQNSTLNKVCIWSVPRTLGTALTKCLSYVDDIQIFYEPFVSAFFFGPEGKSPAPEVAKFINSAAGNQQQEDMFPCAFDDNKCTFAWVRQQLEADYPGKKILFVKDQAFCLDEKYECIPPGLRHAFLIRHPYKVMPSWKRVLAKLLSVDHDSSTWDDIAKINQQPNMYEKQFKLLKYVQENLDPNPVIIDADDLQNNPASILRQFCEAVDIPYSDSLLEWPGDRDIIKTWKGSRVGLQGNQLEGEGGFYENALKSCGFQPASPTPKLSELAEDLREIAEESLTYYEQMYPMRVKP